MRERPILFSAPMVRAILDGRKTQTRRVVKPQPRPDRPPRIAVGVRGWDGNQFTTVRSPYGLAGDRLWVRETWRQAYPKTSYSEGIVYRADKPKALGMDEYSDRHKWRPSIFMARAASRITLEVTGARIERLQAISKADAIAEGVEYEFPIDPRDAFRSLWWSINGAESWDANPWVWVVEFKRVTP